VYITGVTLYQGVERPLMVNGAAASTTVPIVAGRDGMVRVFYSTDGAYNGQPVTMRLALDGQPPLEVTAALSGASTDDNLASTLNVDVPGSALAQSTGYRIELLQSEELNSGANAAASYPATGTELIPVQSAGAQLRIVLVPLAYGADGSNRLPDTTPTQIEIYRNQFYRLYPVPEVEIEVHNPVQWNSTISAWGNGWDSVLNYMIDYRQSGGVADDQYLYGIFTPASSFGAYCQSGCVSGLSLLGQSPGDSYARVGVGIGFSGESSADTAAHELGHQHGRNHAPCGAQQGIDNSYPYSGGGIGTWGYDLVSGQLVNPSQHTDIMGYCNPTWVSDYNFTNFFNRIKSVNGAKLDIPIELQNQPYERISIGPDGTVQWLGEMVFELPPLGEQIAVTIDSDQGAEELAGHFYPYSHIDGGVLVFPKRPTASTASFELAGQFQSVQR